ncbi:MAG: Hsp70 family protein [Deltaproteobacteria bacterium]|nr:Hsp70 family protein [Nannocystaceae bacterium]
MVQRPLYVGIDLGTTNSAVAVFDGETNQVVRNAQGASLTPSVVRFDAAGRVTVGAAARRFLERDSDNTKSEFKRLMGTDRALGFPASGREATPQQLAAEILRALRGDVRDQLGVLPITAVISVPALFELPQSAATAEAAQLAGFDRVELLQEPIASALAAGWSAEQGDGRWLVYDLGGGTFDASLLETDAGFLRVVGHDGDNFLGGRDFDWAIVDWAIAQIHARHGVLVDRSEPSHAHAVAQLKLAAEEVKIQLSRADEVALVLPAPLAIPGAAPVDPELVLDRGTLEGLIAPVVERSIEVCQRLLREHDTEASRLARIVFVGGPTVTPLLRQRVGDALGAPIADGLDPMTLVAQGAAIYAATAGLDGRPVGPMVRRGARLWLQYPAVSSDLTPHVVGRVIEGEGGPMPARVRLLRDDGWSSEPAVLDEQHAFATMVELMPRRANAFSVVADDGSGNEVPVDPSAITIVQGLTITDPPLARSIGVALVSDHVQIYFERGAPLPARRTFTQTTVESVARGSSEVVLKIPIVQGEHDRAHLCRLVGTLEIPGHALNRSLPAGSDIELTLELDRGGRLAARALVPALDQVFEHVAQLLVPAADLEVLTAGLDQLRKRVDDLRADAFRHGMPQMITALSRAEQELGEVGRDLGAARGGNDDAGQRARRTLIEIDAKLDEVEQSKQWPELEKRAVRTMTWASSWISHLGSERERALFDEVGHAVDHARNERNVRELQRQLRLANQLGETAWYRDPDTWPDLFEEACSRVDGASDLPRAQALVREGREARAKDDAVALRRITERLWKLLPHDPATRQKSYDSGVR